MRDLETMEAALKLAETGHLTMATLHTNSAAQTITRIVDAFPAHQQAQIRTQLSLVLEGIVCQALMPKIAGRGASPPSRSWWRRPRSATSFATTRFTRSTARCRPARKSTACRR